MASSDLLILLTLLGDLPVVDRLRIALLIAFGVVWFFWLGAALGSYLNVLVYRLPLGLPTVAPDSRCPKCKTPIRWYDNIPIYGWLALGGKCRACHQRISPRYLIVEAVVGSLFVLLLVAEVLTGGANLPGGALQIDVNTPLIERFVQGRLLAIYAYHVLLIWLMVGICLFAMDGHRVPRSYRRAALALVLLPPMIWPQLHLVPVWLPVFETGLPQGMVSTAIGAIAGLSFGSLLSLAVGSKTEGEAASSAALLGTLVGGALGWHAALLWFSISAVAWILHLLACLLARRSRPQSLTVIAAASLVALLVGWCGFYEGYPRPVTQPENSAAWQLTLAAVLAVFAVACGRYLDARLSQPLLAPPGGKR